MGWRKRVKRRREGWRVKDRKRRKGKVRREDREEGAGEALD